MTTFRIVFWAILAWIVIIPLAIANGLLRQFVLAPSLGIGLAQPISGLVLILLIAGVARGLVRRVGARRYRVWLTIGLGWGLATFGFECSLLFMSGGGLSDLAAQYNFTDNNLWPLVLLWTITAPSCLAALVRLGPETTAD